MIYDYSKLTFQELVSKIETARYWNLPSMIQQAFLKVGTIGGTASIAVSQAFSNAPTFTAFPLVMAQKQINAPTTITVNKADAVAGASVLIRLIADGVSANTPVFVGAEQVTGSSGWDNRTGIINLVQMQFDGTDVFYSIVQKALGAVLDLQAPVFLSSTINTTGTIATLTFNEDLLTTSLPIPNNFTGATVTSVSIANKLVTLNINPALASGTSTNLVYSGTAIKDLAGNSSSGFTTSLTVAPIQVITTVNLSSRQAGIGEVVIGTYNKILANGWQAGASSTLNFTGDKTYEVSDVSLSSSQAIIGLDTKTIVDANFIYQNLKLGISYYGGSYKAFIDGVQTTLIGHAVGDRMRLTRTMGVLKAQFKRGMSDWADLFIFPQTATTIGALSTNVFLDDLNSQLSLILV